MLEQLLIFINKCSIISHLTSYFNGQGGLIQRSGGSVRIDLTFPVITPQYVYVIEGL